MFCDVCYVLKGEESVVQKIEFQIPEYIRRTYIETYRSCPHKFLKEVIEGNESPPTSYTQVGIDLHELFEFAQTNPHYTAEGMKNSMKVKFDEYSDDLFKSDFKSDTRTHMWQRAVDSIDAFYNILPNLPSTPFQLEQTLFFSIGEDLPKVRITMDRIDEEGGDLVLHDWKTGKVMVGQKISTDLQAPLYIKAVQNEYGRLVKRFHFHYLQENKTRVFEHVHGEDYVCRVGKREYKINLQDAIREVNSIFSRIVKGDFNIPQDVKKMYFTCKMCHLREQGLCQGADMQSWHNTNQQGGWSL